MPGAFKPVAFEPYGRRRSRARLPGWLLWLLSGAVLGIGGAWIVQERMLPQRLSPEESLQLRTNFERAESERVRLANELRDSARLLETARVEKKQLGDELEAVRNASSTLQADVSALVDALPADPRAGVVGVRAASFSVERGMLAYDVVLTRERPGDKPLDGVMQVAVAGTLGRARDTVTLDPVSVSVGLYQSLRGRLSLPEGFIPRQATVKVLDADASRLLGMRVLNVSSMKGPR